MKIKLLLLLSLSHELFAFFTPQDMMDRMTLKNAKNMMLMPLHPEKKVQQGLRLMEEMGTLFEYSVTQATKNATRSVSKKDNKIPSKEFSLY